MISDWFGTHSAAAVARGRPRPRDARSAARARGRAARRRPGAARSSEARVDESVLRLLELFAWAGVGDDDGQETTDDSPETRAVIRRAAIAATVLLKNDGDCSRSRPRRRVALIGPNSERGHIQGGGSARVRASQPVADPRRRCASAASTSCTSRVCSIDKRLPPLRGRFDGRLHRSPTAPRRSRQIERLHFMWMDDPAPGIDVAIFGATHRRHVRARRDGRLAVRPHGRRPGRAAGERRDRCRPLGRADRRRVLRHGQPRAARQRGARGGRAGARSRSKSACSTGRCCAG